MEQIKTIEFTTTYPGTNLKPEKSRYDVIIRPLSRPHPVHNGLNEDGVSFTVLGCGLGGPGPDKWGTNALTAEDVAAVFTRSNGKPRYDSARWV
jgi:hypothetical protein